MILLSVLYIGARRETTLYVTGKKVKQQTWHTVEQVDSFVTHGGNVVRKVTVEYNAIYNCIWHAPVELTYKQLGFNNFGFFGDQYYAARNVDGSTATVPLAYEVKNNDSGTASKKVRYTFGYPVFSIEHQYPFQLSAVERYFWNNIIILHLSLAHYLTEEK